MDHNWNANGNGNKSPSRNTDATTVSPRRGRGFGSTSKRLGAAAALGISGIFFFVAWVLFTAGGVRWGLERWVPSFIDLPGDTILSELGSTAPDIDLDHVFTATAASSEHVHVSQRSALLDPAPSQKGEPGMEPVLGNPQAAHIADAVQASAAFPGLPKVRIAAADLGFGAHNGTMALSDGGTIDNLGHIRATLEAPADDDSRHWLTGWGEITGWFVVDASAAPSSKQSRRFKAPNRMLEVLHLGVFADIAGLANDHASETTRSSAEALRARFAEQRDGVYFHLSHSPYELCVAAIVDGASTEQKQAATSAIRHVQNERDLPDGYQAVSPRAESALKLLASMCAATDGSAQAEWQTRCRDHPRVATTLRSLNPTLASELMYHGWMLAMTTAVLELGWPLPEDPSLLRYERFEQAPEQ